ncbi:hemerythrin HHE cation-binding protein [Pleurocapsales cyanobacterium LEGE 10410]|nr:hemerythrin HHE cation-binding protein [Pleurocapsales cyanobacterium LEGE 10410]
MAATLDATKKNAIATKLADMKALQNLMISNQEKLLAASKDNQKVTETLTDMLEDDRKSLTAINEAITELEMSSDPNDTVTNMIQTIEGVMSEDSMSLYEKFMQHEGLKHQLTMTGLLVHKAAQATDGILQKLIDPINKVNFKNRAHQEQLKGAIYFYGVRQLVGEEPEAGIWAAAEDAVAALKGAFGGLTE